MSDLIPILSRPVGDEINSVDARELHRELGVGRDFTNWIKGRIEDARLVQGSDWEVFAESGENPNGGRPRSVYVLTLDAAKAIAMLEGTAKGAEVRAYFIAAEKRLRTVSDPLAMLSDPATLRGLLGSYAERVQSLEATVAETAPKARIFDAVMSSDDTTGLRETAKILRDRCGTNEREVISLMAERKWVTRLGKRLAPAHYGQERGYVTARLTEWKDDTGLTHTKPELRVTPKGLAKLADILLGGEA